MEKEDIIVGRFCIENNAILGSLLKRYNVYTSDLVFSRCERATCEDIITMSLSHEEMDALLTFYSSNTCLAAIGFIEASCLFLSREKAIPVAVADSTTERICIELRIQYKKFRDITTHLNVLQSDNKPNSSHEKGIQIPSWLKPIKIACL